ncbi:hypothetical protein Tco_1330025 [Tanacetum coccineum]
MLDLLRCCKRLDTFAYKLELLQELNRVHNTFYVSDLKKCYFDEPLVVPLEGLHVDDKLYFVQEAVDIMDREVKRLKLNFITGNVAIFILHSYMWSISVMNLGKPSDEELEAPIDDQPLPVDALPTALSPGYIVDFDPEEDPADHPIDGGDNDNNESSDDDKDDDDVVKDEEE